MQKPICDAALLAFQLNNLTEQGYQYAIKLWSEDQALIQYILSQTDKPTFLPLITSIHSQSDYNHTVKQLWTLIKDYWNAVNFRQHLWDEGITKTQDSSTAWGFFFSEQPSCLDNQPATDSWHSSDITEEISWSLPQNQPQDSQSHTSMKNLTWDDIQNIIQATVAAALAAQQQPSLRLSDSLSSSGSADLNDNNSGEACNFRAKNVGMFDSNLNVDAVKVKDDRQIYHNVFSFINQVHVKATTMKPALLQQNLKSCLLEKADRWYTEELAHLTCVRLQNDNNDVEEWCKTLKARFRDSPSQALTMLEFLQFTVYDAHCCRNPVDYVQSIVLHRKNSSIVTSDHAQVLLAYKHFDDKLQLHLSASTEQSTVVNLIKTLNFQKNIWYDIYTCNNSLSNTALSDWDQQRPQADRDCSFQPFSSRFPSYGYSVGNSFRPFSYNNQPLYGDRFSNNNYEQGNNQQQIPESRQVTDVRQLLQITSENERQSSDSYQNQYQNQNCPLYGVNINVNKPFYRSYQAECSYQYNCSYQLNRPQAYHAQQKSDDQKKYQAYEDAYYERAYWQKNQMKKHNPADEETAEAEKNAEPAQKNSDSNAVNVGPIAKTRLVTCRKCHQEFPSNNQLHWHVQNSCTKPQLKATVVPYTFFKPATLLSVYIQLSATDTFTNEYGFWEWRYATAQAQLTHDGDNNLICLDTGCIMTLVNQQFLREQALNTVIWQMPSSITVCELGLNTHESDEYAIIDLYLSSKNEHIAIISHKAHLVDNLRAQMLVEIDILASEAVSMNLHRQVAVISSCDNVEVPLTVTTCFTNQINQLVYIKQCMIISSKSHNKVAISITELSHDQDLFFESDCWHREAIVYAYIVNHTLSEVHVWNNTDKPLIISRQTRMRRLVEYKADGCYLTTSDDVTLAFLIRLLWNWMKHCLWGMLTAAAYYINMKTSVMNTSLEHKLTNSITIYDDQATTLQIEAVVNDYPQLWQDCGNVIDVPESEWMKIPLLDNWKKNYKPEQVKVYSVEQQDCEIINKAFDTLQEQNRLKWTTSATSFMYSCFVV